MSRNVEQENQDLKDAYLLLFGYYNSNFEYRQYKTDNGFPNNGWFRFNLYDRHLFLTHIKKITDILDNYKHIHYEVQSNRLWNNFDLFVSTGETKYRKGTSMEEFSIDKFLENVSDTNDEMYNLNLFSIKSFQGKICMYSHNRDGIIIGFSDSRVAYSFNEEFLSTS
jgi:hypothetical protein